MLRLEHRAGENMFVDYAGPTIPIYHASGEVNFAAAIFVAVLGAWSNRTASFAELCLARAKARSHPDTQGP